MNKENWYLNIKIKFAIKTTIYVEQLKTIPYIWIDTLPGKELDCYPSMHIFFTVSAAELFGINLVKEKNLT